MTEFTPKSQEEYKNLVKQIIKELEGKADKIIISGGAYYLNEEELKNQLDFGRTANIIFSNKPFEFANVRGYYKAMNKILKGKK